MKKVFRLTAIAVITLGLATACGAKKTAEVEDTTADTLMTVVEAVIDTVEEEEPVVEEPVVKKNSKPAPKKEVKNEEPSPANVKPTKIGEDPVTTTTTKGEAKKVENKVAPTKIGGTTNNDAPTKGAKKN